jgi:hypothetical protein
VLVATGGVPTWTLLSSVPTRQNVLVGQETDPYGGVGPALACQLDATVGSVDVSICLPPGNAKHSDALGQTIWPS